MPARPSVVDLVKDNPTYFGARKSPRVERLRAATFLAIDGSGSPSGESFPQAIGALYGVAYTLKFALKEAGRPTFKVAPLEGLWWLGRTPTKAPDFDIFHTTDPNAWRWRLLVMIPKGINAAKVAATGRALTKAKGESTFSKVRLQRLNEKRVVQLLHVGPYGRERPSLAALHGFAAEQGLSLRGPHHEIYLNNPQRTAPAKLRTILRYPVR